MVKYEVTGETYYYSIGYTYDKLNNLTQLVENVNGEIHTTSYTYDDDNRITGFSHNGIGKDYTYDAYGRLVLEWTSDNAASVLKKVYSYQDLRANEYTSAQVNGYSLVSDSYNKNFHYTYDANGNITKITEGTGDNAPVVAEYTYDKANQLLTEVLPGQRKTVWTYDNAGNIQTRTEHTWEDGSWDEGTTVDYEYGDAAWGDLLTSYDNKPITYDQIGNPISDGTWTYTWQHGRQLASMTNADASVTWNYTYDADGLRTKRVRTVGDTTTTWEYVYSGGQLVQMTKGDDTLYFAYDAAGAPMTVTHKVGNTETTYYYATNLQGDIIAILDDDGNPVVQYTYDAWGNPMGTILSENQPNAATLAELNPLRYRGYVYDTETALYYLQSRYYNPKISRFLNADGLVATGQGFIGNNMFAYCGNNPVCNTDTSGTRYCAATSIKGESLKDRKISCAFQNDIARNRSKPNFGSARPYQENSLYGVDCLGYALGINDDLVLSVPKGISLEDAALLTVEIAESKGKRIRPLASCYSPIDANEYRIALAVGAEDIHYMVQHSDGTWSHKPGYCVSRLIIGANPSVVTWDLPIVDEEYFRKYYVIKEIGVHSDYYNQGPIYFAVS